MLQRVCVEILIVHYEAGWDLQHILDGLKQAHTQNKQTNEHKPWRKFSGNKLWSGGWAGYQKAERQSGKREREQSINSSELSNHRIPGDTRKDVYYNSTNITC